MATTKKRVTFKLDFTVSARFKDFGFILTDMLSKYAEPVIQRTGYETLKSAKRGYSNLQKRLGFPKENVKVEPEVKTI